MSQRRRVLLIEANPGDRDLVAAYLERTDYALQSAEGGALGLSLATVEPPDLILLDLSLPDMDGYEVCRRLREDPRTRRSPWSSSPRAPISPSTAKVTPRGPRTVSRSQ